MTNKPQAKLTLHRVFIARVTRSALIGLFLLYFGLSIGMYGYHIFAGMNWVDSFVNAAMILAGMGPVSPIDSVSGKIFAGFYALFSGIFFVLIVGIMFSPVAHRVFKAFKLEDEHHENNSE